MGRILRHCNLKQTSTKVLSTNETTRRSLLRKCKLRGLTLFICQCKVHYNTRTPEKQCRKFVEITNLSFVLVTAKKTHVKLPPTRKSPVTAGRHEAVAASKFPTFTRLQRYQCFDRARQIFSRVAGERKVPNG